MRYKMSHRTKDQKAFMRHSCSYLSPAYLLSKSVADQFGSGNFGAWHCSFIHGQIKWSHSFVCVYNSIRFSLVCVLISVWPTAHFYMHTWCASVNLARNPICHLTIMKKFHLNIVTVLFLPCVIHLVMFVQVATLPSTQCFVFAASIKLVTVFLGGHKNLPLC